MKQWNEIKLKKLKEVIWSHLKLHEATCAKDENWGKSTKGYKIWGKMKIEESLNKRA